MKEIIAKETMSSREIAQITGKPHNDVLKSIRRMERGWVKVTGGNFSLSKYTDSTGRKLPQYELNKMECLYIATKFNDEARARLIIRWEELEKGKVTKNPTTKKLSIAQKRRLQRTELIESIKANLLRGDVTDVARANGFSIETTQNVMRGKTFRPKIVKALFDKAMQRKKELNNEVQEMINQLNQ